MSEARLYKGRLPPICGLLVLTADSITENMSTFPASRISQGTGSFDLMIGGGDILDSQQGDATLYGGDGNDTISGYRDNDMLHGGAGNEILWGDKCGPDRMEENIFVCPLLEPEDAASYSPASSWHASIAA